MTEKNELYDVCKPFKGWPVRGANSLKDASEMILGSPYWEVPEDRYIVIDKNDTYSLLAVYANGNISPHNRYMAVNHDLIEKSCRVVIGDF